MLKRLISFFVILLLLLAPCASAHPGRTDSQGGHYESATGDYHFHHGYPEHQHYNGVCPYDFATATPRPTSNNTRATSTPKKSSSSNYSSSSKKTTTPTTQPITQEEPIGKELRMKIIIGLSIAVALLLTALVFALRALFKTKEEKNSLQKEISDLQHEKWILIEEIEQERNVVQQEKNNLINETNQANQRLQSILRFAEELKPFIHNLAAEAYSKRLTTLENEQPIKPIGSYEPPTDEPMVIITQGKKFHFKEHGYWFNSKEVPLSQAILKGYEPCQICCPDLKTATPTSEPIVWFSEKYPVFYHKNFFCDKMLFRNGIPLSETVQRKLRPCELCNPPIISTNSTSSEIP